MGNNNSHCDVANKKNKKMKILTTIWVILIIYCILEAIFCTIFVEDNNIEENLKQYNKKITKKNDRA